MPVGMQLLAPQVLQSLHREMNDQIALYSLGRHRCSSASEESAHIGRYLPQQVESESMSGQGLRLAR